MKLHLGTLALGISFFFLSSYAREEESNAGHRPPHSPEIRLFRSRVTGASEASSASPASHDENSKRGLLPASPITAGLLAPKLIRREKKPWTGEEEQRLLKLRGKDLSWVEIQESFPGRTWGALQHKYQRLTHDPSASPPRPKGKFWTAEEEKLLLDLVEEGIPLNEMTEALEGRTENAIRSKYRYLMKGSPVPKALLKAFTAEEDELLLELAQMDTTWEEKAESFEGRNANALQHRYRRIVPDGHDLRLRWTPEDEELLIEAVEAGMTWEEMAQLFERDEESVKRRVGSLLDSGRLDLAPQIAARRRYTTTDFELMQEKLDEGMSWEDMANSHFPGRSPNSMRIQFKKYKRKKMEEE